MEKATVGKTGKTATSTLWVAVRSGTVHDVDAALVALKKANASVDSRDRFGSTALHIATWRNHVPIVKRLLAAGADPDARDGESGWGSLHRALHFGHLAVAGVLIEAGASLHLEDAKGRIPVDLVSGPLIRSLSSSSHGAVIRELFSWGNGSNYQLGTGTAGIQRIPCRVEALQGVDIVAVSAAKFHSVAVSSTGAIFSWGYGRGGRLGHEDYSGEVAVITPRQITSGLGGRKVKTVSAAKHHTIIATEGGEVYTWGTNREGQLGYPSVDTQSTPRRVISLRAKVIAVAAANKHSAAVTECGEVFTWGCNREGQLGYGTSNSASNCVPRIVDYLKGKKSVAVSAAKYHTIALVEGEVYTWGNRMVSPRRVMIVRNTRKAGPLPLKFHQSERLQIVAIAAGFVHSTAVAADGMVFTWLSADPHLHAQPVLSMSRHQSVSVSAGKYRTALVTATGDVYAWDSDTPQESSSVPVPSRVHGIKRVMLMAVGERHSLAVSGIYVPAYSPIDTEVEDIVAEVDSEVLTNLTEEDGEEQLPLTLVKKTPSLRDLCQKVIADSVVEPRNALQLLEFADSLGADELKRHCERLILRNLDYMITFFATSLGNTRSSVLADLEKAWDACSSEPWSHRQLPVPSATMPATVDSEEDENESSVNHRTLKDLSTYPTTARVGFLQDDYPGGERAAKQSRAIRKKLQQIEALELKLANGQSLDGQQLAKLRTKASLIESLKELGITDYTEPVTVPKPSQEHSKQHRQKGKKNTSKKNDAQVLMKKDWPEEKPEEVYQQKMPQLDQVKEPNPSSIKLDASIVNNTQPHTSKKTVKPKGKKGGLSLFLTGGLDNVAEKAPPVPIIVKGDGPAWGGSSMRKGVTSSLSDIQSEQKAESSCTTKVATKGDTSRVLHSERGNQKVSLQEFVRPSAPIAVMKAAPCSPNKASPGKAAPWIGTTPPGGSVPSLRDIQMQEQAKHKERQQRLRANQQHVGSPPVSTKGFGATSPASTPESLERSSVWYKPEVSSPSSIRCIQIEEKAIKDLRRLYKDVKLVNM